MAPTVVKGKWYEKNRNCLTDVLKQNKKTETLRHRVTTNNSIHCLLHHLHIMHDMIPANRA